jgi:hypothetical protein
MIAEALQAAGYEGEPTRDNLIECFMDYLGAGYWSNSDDLLDDFNSGLLTDEQICKALMN